MVKLGGTDVDDHAAAPVPVGVASAGGDDQDVIGVEGHLVDAVVAQSSLQCVEGLRASGSGVVGEYANELAGGCVHVVQDAAAIR